MSQRPAQKGNFFQTLLLVTTIYLGFMLISGGFNRTPDVRTADEMMASLRQMNARILDVQAAALLPVLSNKIKEEAKKNGTPQAQVDAKILEATVLTANTQYRSALLHPGYAVSKLNKAYMTLSGPHKSKAGTPLWNEAKVALGQPESVKSREMFPEAQITPDQAYETIVEEYSGRLKDDRILGIVPGYQLIDALVGMTGKVPSFSYAFAAFILALVVRAVVWPLAQRQLMWGRKMSQLQPLIKDLQEKYNAKDPKGGYRSSPEFQQKVMELYKEYGINPFAGCLPVLVQMPFFLIIYYCMVSYRFEFQKGTFLWINGDLGAASGGWIGRSLGDMDYILILIYGISMVVTTLLTPVSDPTNARQQRLMGIGIAVFFSIGMFFWPLPSAFVLYWIFLNVLSTFQSLRAYRLPMPPLTKVSTAAGGAIALNGNGPISNKVFEQTGAPKVQKPKAKKKR